MSLSDVIDKTIEENKAFVDNYLDNDCEESLNSLIGKCIQNSSGKYKPNEIKQELVSQLDNTNKDVNYPLELSLYHRENETSIAEQLANKLRTQLDVPLDSVHVPNRFHVPELELKYKIHHDGSVEFIEVQND